MSTEHCYVWPNQNLIVKQATKQENDQNIQQKVGEEIRFYVTTN